MLDGLARRNGGKAGLAVLAAILALTLGLRVAEAWDGRAPVYDAAAYAAIAANLERGEGFTVGAEATQPSSNYSPGLPLLVAGIYALRGGPDEQLARLVLAAVGSLAVLFTYLIGRRLGGPLAGLVGATAIAVYPALLEYQGMLMGEPLAATLLSATVLAMLWAADSGASTGRWLAAGLPLGALAMVRPEYLGVAILLSALVAARGNWVGWRPALGGAAVLLGSALLVVAPWTTRNAAALDRFVPISTGGGQVLFAGTYLPSDGDPERVGAEVVARHPELFAPGAVQRLRLEQILARLAAARYPGVETDRALGRMGRERLGDDIREEPLRYAEFVATKATRLWLNGQRRVMDEPPWKALHLALLGLGLLGLGVLLIPRTRRTFVTQRATNVHDAAWGAAIIVTVFLAITALSALLVASPRRVLVMLPLLAALAGVGVAWLRELLRARRDREPSPARGKSPSRPDSLPS